MTRLTRRYHFPASHRLHSPGLSDAENRALYGKCNNPFGHGHNYVLEISVAGPVDGHGQVVVRQTLDALVEAAVLRDFRNRNLNLDVPEFLLLVPTSENVAVVTEGRLRAAWAGAFGGGWPMLEKVRLFETGRNVVEHMTPLTPGTRTPREAELARRD